MAVVLHLSPHPDDELLGAPAALMALRDAGHEVVNVALGLGRPQHHARRRAELQEACGRAGFRLVVAEPPLPLSASDDLRSAEARVADLLRDLVRTNGPALVAGPWVHDRHHAHELVGRAVRRVLGELDDPPVWWAWGLWGDLPVPTLLVPYGATRLGEIRHALAAHRGEVSRNDYLALVEARARANAVLGPERVFGFGAPGRPEPYADLVTEIVRRDRRWWLGAPRSLRHGRDLTATATRPADAWVLAPSAADLLGASEQRRGGR